MLFSRFPYARDFPFNNVLYTFITLFELLTLEGWTEVNDLFQDKNEGRSDWVSIVSWYYHDLFFPSLSFSLSFYPSLSVHGLLYTHLHFPGCQFGSSVISWCRC